MPLASLVSGEVCVSSGDDDDVDDDDDDGDNSDHLVVLSLI